MNRPPRVSARTYAIVVGIENYNLGPRWRLEGPADDAERFIRWLLDCHVPADQIFAFISPVEIKQGRLRELGVEVNPARHSLINDVATTKLSRLSGDLLCFYWVGHGVIDARGNRRLYCVDATEVNPRHLSLNSLLACWRTDLIGNFPRQIGFVDACANYLELARTLASMPEDVLPLGTPKPDVEQYFLLAASPGEVAKNSAVKKSGYFSQAVFEELARSGRDLPPPMQQINLNLMERFAALRDANRAQQTPAHFWYHDWKGSEGTLAAHARSSPAPQANDIDLTNEERDELVLALLEFEVIAEKDQREAIIKDLRREIRFSRIRGSTDRLDVDNLVKAALRYPGGLQELMRVVERFRGADQKAWENLEMICQRYF